MAKPLLFDSTGQQILGALERQNAILAGWSGNKDVAVSSMAEIGAIVRSGNASKVFSIGDRIIVPYHYGSETYDFVWVVHHFAQVELPSGEIVPGMYLQALYNTIESVPFDVDEAFYYNASDSALPAGTYHINLNASWSQAIADNYQFTLPVALPSKGKLTAFNYGADNGMTNAKLKMYQSNGKTLVSGGDNITVTSGSGGTSLGVMAITTGGTLRPLHYVGYGCNRWDYSAYRQWLNSSENTGAWWTPKHDYDIAPSQVSSYKGFMAGFEEDFLNQIGPVKVTTALNTAVENGALVSTYDTFFLPSMAEMYISPQIAGEGELSVYWQRVLGKTSPVAVYNTYPEFKGFNLNNHASTDTQRLRSATRSYGYYTWGVYSTGGVNGSYACPYAYRSRPLCVIR